MRRGCHLAPGGAAGFKSGGAALDPRARTGGAAMARIMLAEDDDSMRAFLAAALTRAGHEVAAFADGWSALGGEPAGFDLLIADIVMPGIDGVELARRARQARPDLRVMFITGFAAVVLDGGRPPLPGASVLSKPFHLKDLVGHVELLLASPPARAPSAG
jgi:two-component system cell cycle response regulator CpdR